MKNQRARSSPRLLALAVSGITSGIASDTASAQASAPSDGIQEVVVTAQRTPAPEARTPVTMSVLTAEQLDKLGLDTPGALSARLPDTYLENSYDGLRITIRGVSSNDPTEKGDPSAAFMIDGVYIARPQSQNVAFFDIDRIEVLRGPQGTLYGRNTIGGAVKYVTKRLAPKAMLDAKATLGKFGEKDLVLKGSTPVSDILRIGGTIATFNRDGFGENVVNGRDNYNKDVKAARVSAELIPNSDLFVRFSSDRTVDDSEPRQGYRLTPGPAPANLAPLAGQYDTRANLYAVNGHKRSEEHTSELQSLA